MKTYLYEIFILTVRYAMVMVALVPSAMLYATIKPYFIHDSKIVLILCLIPGLFIANRMWKYTGEIL